MLKIIITTNAKKQFEIIGETATFYCDHVEIHSTNDLTGEEIVLYQCNKYEIPVKLKNNLFAEISANYEDWLKEAKLISHEKECQKIRDYRDKLLNECDLKLCNAELWESMSENEKEKWKNYKQALRDLTLQEGFPYVVNIPKKPK